MRPKREEWYIGIETGRKWTQISCYHAGLAEPETKSTIVGTEVFQIPTALCKHKQTGQWYFGEEGRRLAEIGEGYYAADLLYRAWHNETITLDQEYSTQELFVIFCRKVLRLALPVQGCEAVTKCIFSLEKVTEEIVVFFQALAQKLGFTEDQIQIQDHRESFYAYVVSQDSSLWKQQVLLFEEEGDGVLCRLLSCGRTAVVPKPVEVAEVFLGKLPQEHKERDQKFVEMAGEALAGRIVSAVYLIGSGFEGGWMKESLKLVCRSRRAFQGKNLYTRGACYAGVLQRYQDKAETIYVSEYKIKESIFIKAVKGNQAYFYPMLVAGENRYQVSREFRLILEGEDDFLELHVQKPGDRDARVESLNLAGLSVSAQGRSRLSVSVSAGEEGRIFLRLRDLGWGMIKPASGQEWEYELDMASSEFQG